MIYLVETRPYGWFYVTDHAGNIQVWSGKCCCCRIVRPYQRRSGKI